MQHTPEIKVGLEEGGERAGAALGVHRIHFVAVALRAKGGARARWLLKPGRSPGVAPSLPLSPKCPTSAPPTCQGSFRPCCTWCRGRSSGSPGGGWGGGGGHMRRAVVGGQRGRRKGRACPGVLPLQEQQWRSAAHLGDAVVHGVGPQLLLGAGGGAGVVRTHGLDDRRVIQHAHAAQNLRRRRWRASGDGACAHNDDRQQLRCRAAHMRAWRISGRLMR